MKSKKLFVGLDVHKQKTAYAVRDSDGSIVDEGVCASTPADLYGVLEPYLPAAVVGMECNTEVYPVREYFLKKNCQIRVANTIQLRNLISKSDKFDARRLTDMLR